MDTIEFTAMYLTHHPRILRLVSSKLPLATRAEAEDITSATFERAWRNRGLLGSLAPTTAEPLWSWLATVAVRLVIDRSRRRWRESPLFQGESLVARGDLAQDVADRVTVDVLLARVTPLQRQALRLWSIGTPTTETAAIMGVGPLSLTKLRKRGLAMMRRVVLAAAAALSLAVLGAAPTQLPRQCVVTRGADEQGAYTVVVEERADPSGANVYPIPAIGNCGPTKTYDTATQVVLLRDSLAPGYCWLQYPSSLNLVLDSDQQPVHVLCLAP